MAIYAISDLHLSLGTDKPMDVFGDRWKDHVKKLEQNWNQVVGEDDFVLIPGDISWGINLDEALPDFSFIESLSGIKIISKGNHDYWWSTRRKFQSFLDANGFKTISMLHNNTYRVGGYTICGSRGWIDPGDPGFDDGDREIFSREMERLRLSLEQGKRLGGRIIAMLHYPPFDSGHRANDFASLLKEYNAEMCVYGHIHGWWEDSWRDEVVDGIRYLLVSADFLSFMPMRVA